MITATFIGADGSMGFRKNHTYTLHVSNMSVRDVKGGPWVPYGSLAAFFRNWIVKGG